MTHSSVYRVAPATKNAQKVLTSQVKLCKVFNLKCVNYSLLVLPVAKSQEDRNTTNLTILERERERDAWHLHDNLHDNVYDSLHNDLHNGLHNFLHNELHTDLGTKHGQYWPLWSKAIPGFKYCITIPYQYRCNTSYFESHWQKVNSQTKVLL